MNIERLKTVVEHIRQRPDSYSAWCFTQLPTSPKCLLCHAAEISGTEAKFCRTQAGREYLELSVAEFGYFNRPERTLADFERVIELGRIPG